MESLDKLKKALKNETDVKKRAVLQKKIDKLSNDKIVRK
jgi:hypothetical protein